MTSEHGNKMLSHLPPYYETSRVMKSILQGQGAELDGLRQALDETLNQFFVRTATWGLDLWEEKLGITTLPDQPTAERRDKIVAALRGFGTATIGVVKRVAEAYDHGEIDISENHTTYAITVYFVDTTGVPPNLNDFKTAIRAILPAHLEVFYAFNYFIWDELDAKLWTWDALDIQTLTWDRLEVLS